jgi:hypothetical protein
MVNEICADKAATTGNQYVLHRISEYSNETLAENEALNFMWFQVSGQKSDVRQQRSEDK